MIELAGGGRPSWVITLGPDYENELKPPEAILTFWFGLSIMLVVEVCCISPEGWIMLSDEYISGSLGVCGARTY